MKTVFHEKALSPEEAAVETHKALKQMKAVGGGLPFQLEGARMIPEMFKTAVKQLKEEQATNNT